MHAVMINTLHYATKLEQAGVPHSQAVVQAEALAEAINGQVATKEEAVRVTSTTQSHIENLVLSTQQDFEKYRSHIKSEIFSLEQKLTTQLSEFKYAVTKWIIGTTVAQTAIVISCIKLIH